MKMPRLFERFPTKPERAGSFNAKVISTEGLPESFYRVKNLDTGLKTVVHIASSEALSPGTIFLFEKNGYTLLKQGIKEQGVRTGTAILEKKIVREGKPTTREEDEEWFGAFKKETEDLGKSEREEREAKLRRRLQYVGPPPPDGTTAENQAYLRRVASFLGK